MVISWTVRDTGKNAGGGWLVGYLVGNGTGLLVKAAELGACAGLQAAALCTHKHTDAAGGRMAHVWDVGLEARTPEFSPGCALGSLFDDLSSGSRGMVCQALRQC